MVTDIELARRLERTEATANARFVEARGRVQPEIGACWIEVAGAYAMYDGPESPCTQTFGLGVFGAPSSEDMDTLEHFFHDRGAPAFHDVSPLAGISLYAMLRGRQYRPVELASVLCMSLHGRAHQPSGLPVRRIRADETELWAATAAEGWREHLDPAELIPLLRISAHIAGGSCFFAEIGGTPVAAGYMHISDGVAILAGASTIPEWRNRGAQRALLEARLMHAAEAGCDLAMMVAEPGSASQRNAERQGFRIAYTRTKWQLDPQDA